MIWMEILANFPAYFIKFNEILKAEVMNHTQSSSSLWTDWHR